MLPKRERLTVSDISALKRGKSAFTALVSMRYIDSASFKASVAVSKKTASNAVDRNRIRRRVYSLLEHVRNDVHRPAMVLIVPKSEFLNAPFNELKAEIRTLFLKAGLI